MSRIRTLGRTRRRLGLASALVAIAGLATFAAIGQAASPAAEPPVNSSAPTIEGKAQQGQTLFGDRGEWAGKRPIDYNLYWQRCDQNGASCANIGGATGNRYTLRGADVGNRVRLRVQATNTDGRVNAFSQATAVVAAANQPPPPPPSGGPAGAIKLPSGETSIPDSSVSLPDRFIISRFEFSPNPLRSRSETITARFRVTDTRGYVIRNALVFVTPLPYGWTSQPPETLTDTNGWATVEMRATASLPRKAAIVMFVRARKHGDNILAGVSSRRLVQMLVALA